MIQSVGSLDRIVEDYLAVLARASEGLPPGRREELISDLREHIAVARAEMQTPTEAAVRTVLDRLGDPVAIAEEARLAEPLTSPAGWTPRPAATPTSELRRTSLSVLAIVLISVLVFVALVVGAVALFQQGSPAILPGSSVPPSGP
jgi:uncharacterized membrane protein